VLLLLPSGCHSASGVSGRNSSKLEELDRFIADKVADKKLPGMAVALVKPGEVAWSAGYGYANVEAQTRVTPDTPFLLASITKIVTGTALMQAWERDVFDLDQDINELLPFKVDNPHLEREVISMRHLATHTSSIIDNDDLYESFYCPGDSEIPLDVLMRNYLVEGGQWYDAQRNFSKRMPGTRYAYSNIAVSLAGYIMETTTGTPLNEHGQAHIFQPLGMRNTGWHLADFNDQSLIAVPYEKNGTPSAKEWFPDADQLHFGYPDWPDGQLRSSVNDMGRFLAAIMNGGELDGVRILREDTVAMMLEPLFPEVKKDVDGQSLFWEHERGFIGHTGSDPGTCTFLFFDPKTQTGAIVLMNEDTTKSNFAGISVVKKILKVGKTL
jgi:CubicO group peptidase (beta-lactamase class C family)